jgi:hypothetical protein
MGILLIQTSVPHNTPWGRTAVRPYLMVNLSVAPGHPRVMRINGNSINEVHW